MHSVSMIPKELVAASAEALILSLLSKGESYGYAIIQEVRRQYATLTRVNDMIQFPADFKPDYRTCVDIVTKSALQKMVAPGLLVVLSHVLYVRRHARGSRVGFSAAT